jgi:8-oxo-dGTP pyrophosphatase MutT (NUDIX family)
MFSHASLFPPARLDASGRSSAIVFGVDTLEIDEIRDALATRTPRLLSARRRAAVAIVLHAAEPGPEVLLIERARRLGDPWSGDMAFPGGHVEARDADPRAAAVRETREEVGLDLARTGAEPLGQLDDLQAGVPFLSPLVVSTFLYRVALRPALAPNHEVASALWVPAARVLDPARHVGYRLGLLRLPGVSVGEPGRHVVWGITYRLLAALFAATGRPFTAI